VTGATGGIGRAIAQALHERGADLVLSGQRAEILEQVASELGALAVPANLGDRDDVQRLLAAAGDVDILVANAALPADGDFSAYPPEGIDAAIDVNLRAPIVMTRALLDGMLARDRGHLVYISSLSGKVATNGSALYSATKYGLRGFAWGVREDVRDTGVGVTTVFPGPIAEAGMFAQTGLEMPHGSGGKTPAHVAGAVITGIERNRGEIDVSGLLQRFGGKAHGLAPELISFLARKGGSKEIADRIASSDYHRERREG
jgi:short-subunit dehydrogenase